MDAVSVQLPPAYAFTFDGTLGSLWDRLNRHGRWTWTDGDSAWLGDYIATRAQPFDGVLRIYVDAGRFVIHVLYRSDKPDAWRDYVALHTMLVDEFLPSIGAQHIVPDEGLDVSGQGYHGPPWTR